MQSPNPLDPRTVLGAVKATRFAGACGGLDRPCARRVRRCAGRDEGTALGSARTKELLKMRSAR